MDPLTHPGPDGPALRGAHGALLAELRSMLDLLAGAQPGPGELVRITELLAATGERLAACQVRDDHSVFGQVVAPPYTVVEWEPTRLTAAVRFGRYFLGGRDAAHGGAVALLFDDLFGTLMMRQSSRLARTASLRTDYRAVTPLDRGLTATVELVQEAGRKRVVRGTLHDGPTMCAEAEALFVDLRPGQP